MNASTEKRDTLIILLICNISCNIASFSSSAAAAAAVTAVIYGTLTFCLLNVCVSCSLGNRGGCALLVAFLFTFLLLIHPAAIFLSSIRASLARKAAAAAAAVCHLSRSSSSNRPFLVVSRKTAGNEYDVRRLLFSFSSFSFLAIVLVGN
mgnify:CR=1 FL=1